MPGIASRGGRHEKIHNFSIRTSMTIIKEALDEIIARGEVAVALGASMLVPTMTTSTTLPAIPRFEFLGLSSHLSKQNMGYTDTFL